MAYRQARLKAGGMRLGYAQNLEEAIQSMDAHVLRATGADVWVADDSLEAAASFVLNLKNRRTTSGHKKECRAVQVRLQSNPVLIGLLQIRGLPHGIC